LVEGGFLRINLSKILSCLQVLVIDFFFKYTIIIYLIKMKKNLHEKKFYAKINDV